jgi:uncharacterized protein RhaS with RHS repeats
LRYGPNRRYDTVGGQFTQLDPIGLAGGMNSYGFAAGDPVNFSDPFGLCAQGADSVQVDVVQCVDEKEVDGKAWAVFTNTEEGNAALQAGVAGMSFTGSSPEGAAALDWLGAQAFGYYVIRGTSTDGNPVLTAGGYKSGFLFLREDVAAQVNAGQMNAMVSVPRGGSRMSVCTVLAHEGLHGGAGLRHPRHDRAIRRIQQGFRCQ